jgi:cytochrome b561
MATTTAGNRFHPLSIGAHWLTVLLLVAVYALIELHDAFPKGSEARELSKHWHEMLGLAVFAIVFVRLALRAIYPAPAIQPPPPAWQAMLARAMHAALYLFLIGMPLLGWAVVSAKGKPVPFFGFELPPLLTPDKAQGRSLEDIHGAIGTLGYFLIGGHALAALWHHYAMHDNTLEHMLPDRASARGAQAARPLPRARA